MINRDRTDTTARARRERELLERYHEHGDVQARDALLAEMLPLARGLAARYAGRGEPMDDLIQAAAVGLVKAIDGFDLSRDVRFSSYATPTVLGELRRHFRDTTWMIRVPRGMQELQLELARERERLTVTLGRSPTVQELADAVARPFEEVLDTLQSGEARRARSFEEPAGDDLTLGDTIGGGDPELVRAETRAVLGDATARLSPRDRAILHLRFVEDLTQTQIAGHVGVSQMQVSRIIRRSLEILRADIGAGAGSDENPTPTKRSTSD